MAKSVPLSLENLIRKQGGLAATVASMRIELEAAELELKQVEALLRYFSDQGSAFQMEDLDLQRRNLRPRDPGTEP